jgi:hypothetical protein
MTAAHDPAPSMPVISDSITATPARWEDDAENLARLVGATQQDTRGAGHGN